MKLTDRNGGWVSAENHGARWCGAASISLVAAECLQIGKLVNRACRPVAPPDFSLLTTLFVYLYVTSFNTRTFPVRLLAAAPARAHGATTQDVPQDLWSPSGRRFLSCRFNREGRFVLLPSALSGYACAGENHPGEFKSCSVHPVLPLLRSCVSTPPPGPIHAWPDEAR